MASTTLAWSSGLTPVSPLTTREPVLTPTPASPAPSRMVAALIRPGGSGLLPADKAPWSFIAKAGLLPRAIGEAPAVRVRQGCHMPWTDGGSAAGYPRKHPAAARAILGAGHVRLRLHP